MSTVVALIDGEHYPPVVRAALAALGAEFDIVTAAFIGGTEKVDASAEDAYGVPVVFAATAEEALKIAIERYGPRAVVDLSDEPVVSSAARFRLASIALGAGVSYRGSDFLFTPPCPKLELRTPTLAVIGTGKRVGKTGFSAYMARYLKASGRNVVVVAMGRGGPSDPELIRGDEVALSTEDLLALAAQGKHASSDNYEDAVMSRVATVGCRRCGGGMAGDTFFSNVPEGARLADGLGMDIVMLEGSGAAIPPVKANATVLVIGAAQGPGYVHDYFGPFRLARADAVILAGAEEPVASLVEVEAMLAAIAIQRPDLPIACIGFRPLPLESVEGKRVFFATTAPPALLPKLVAYLEAEQGCTVVAASAHLSNRSLLRADLDAAAGTFDVLLSELKAAAIDVVAAAGVQAGVPTVLCDNVPISLGGMPVDEVIEMSVDLALKRGSTRSE
ncbi:MAG: 2,3-diphosphoglycerate synthetase [Actinobacteria bacterium HGW-Actinobacteria-6]|nr:MAG: 2,3-diphosphoglycerate synthetase [Actinobacteria bacterium HGW-Actinobacteria-6]